MVKIIEPSFTILTDLEALNTLKMIEIAARTCYQSWNYMDVNSAAKLAKHLVERDHWAMIEHGGMISVRFITNRGVSHEAFRHRLISGAQESTRFVDYAKGKRKELVVVKPANCPYDIETLNRYSKMIDGDYTPFCQYTDSPRMTIDFPYIENEMSKNWIIWLMGLTASETAYFLRREYGAKPQSARSNLPIGIKTEFIISTNLREWYHIFKLRTHPTAHPDIRCLMIPLLAEFKKRIPIIFDDLKDYVM